MLPVGQVDRGERSLPHPAAGLQARVGANRPPTEHRLGTVALLGDEAWAGLPGRVPLVDRQTRVTKAAAQAGQTLGDHGEVGAPRFPLSLGEDAEYPVGHEASDGGTTGSTSLCGKGGEIGRVDPHQVKLGEHHLH